MQNAENACECVREKMIRIPGKNDTGPKTWGGGRGWEEIAVAAQPRAGGLEKGLGGRRA